jgi:hypothetical protein
MHDAAIGKIFCLNNVAPNENLAIILNSGKIKNRTLPLKKQFVIIGTSTRDVIRVLQYCDSVITQELNNELRVRLQI